MGNNACKCNPRIPRRHGQGARRPGARPDRLARAAIDPARPGVGSARGRSRARCAPPYFIAGELPAWRGGRAVIVGSGPSAAGAERSLASRGRSVHVIAVNDSWRLCPDADVAYACDGAWWKARQGLASFQGLRLTHDAGACALFPGLRQVGIARGRDEILASEPGVLGDGGNSGFQAINLAVQCGARQLILVGFDMRLDRGIHWHGKHGRGLNNPNGANVARWRCIIDGCAPQLAAMGVSVVNCSAVSMLEAFPKLPLEKVI